MIDDSLPVKWEVTAAMATAELNAIVAQKIEHAPGLMTIRAF